MKTEQQITKLRDDLIDIGKNLACRCIFCQPDIRAIATMVASLNMVLIGDDRADRFEETAAKVAGKARAGEKVSFSMGVE